MKSYLINSEKEPLRPHAHSSALQNIRYQTLGLSWDNRRQAQQIDQSILDERTIAMLAAAFGIIATLLAGIGIYGTLAYSTAQRTREIGIRMAFGAQRWTVIGLIVREVMVLAGATIAATVPISILAGHSVRSQLFGVSEADPAIYILAILIICIVAALAGFIPARRAATVDPARALRTD